MACLMTDKSRSNLHEDKSIGLLESGEEADVIQRVINFE